MNMQECLACDHWSVLGRRMTLRGHQSAILSSGGVGCQTNPVIICWALVVHLRLSVFVCLFLFYFYSFRSPAPLNLDCYSCFANMQNAAVCIERVSDGNDCIFKTKSEAVAVANKLASYSHFMNCLFEFCWDSVIVDTKWQNYPGMDRGRSIHLIITVLISKNWNERHLLICCWKITNYYYFLFF